jgi:hypothetical protein
MAMLRIESKVAHSSLKKPLPSRAFTAGDIHRVEFPMGMPLYKVTESTAVEASGNLRPGPTGFATPWWFSYDEMTGQDPALGVVRLKGIAEVVARSRATKSDLRAFLRARGAVCLDWNVMTHLLIVQLRRPVVGLVGGCSGQPLYDDVTRAERDGLSVQDVENVRFIGGEQQLYLPGLLPSDLRVIAFGPV